MKTIHFYTFGCKVNQYETQVLREQIQKNGFDISESYKNCDVVVVNSCTVTNEADKQCRQVLRKIKREFPKTRIVLTGCYAINTGEEILKEISDVEVIKDKNKVTALLTNNKKTDNKVSALAGHSRAFVKIQDGCDAFCSYCIVPYVRNEVWSRDEKEILGEVKQIIGNGYAEIVLSGVRLGKYKTGLVDLIKKIIDIDGEFRIRLSSLELSEVDDELIDLMKKNPVKICNHLHIPLQSGSDKILKLMKRPYTTTEYFGKISKIKRQIKDLSITTDVIVGFPQETEKDFYNTKKFIEKIKFSRLHVFKYSVRSGTMAAKLQGHMDNSIKKKRAAILRGLDAELQEEFRNKMVGTDRNVVKEKDSNMLITDNYLKIPVISGLNDQKSKISSIKILKKDKILKV